MNIRVSIRANQAIKWPLEHGWKRLGTPNLIPTTHPSEMSSRAFLIFFGREKSCYIIPTSPNIKRYQTPPTRMVRGVNPLHPPIASPLLAKIIFGGMDALVTNPVNHLNRHRCVADVAAYLTYVVLWCSMNLAREKRNVHHMLLHTLALGEKEKGADWFQSHVLLLVFSPIPNSIFH